jgi:hypothetical protein
MDQVKEFLRQCIKYRFWISIGVAALFAIIAYFVGSGPVRANAEKEANNIKAAHKDVQQYVSGNVPNDQYKPIVDEKTAVLTKDVNTAWRDLYKRQAPLLTWPDTVQERFRKWGRKWPENTAENAVSAAMVDYIEAYPKYVTEVYKTFHPFDYQTGQGIVSAPPEEALLRPSVFDIAKLPELGKIWAAQERLWIQRTALEVVAQVNKNAKDWDAAIIKQINMLEVGSNVAQDQRSLAKGETLEESEAIKAPGSETAEAAAPADTGAMGGMMQSMMMAGRRGGYAGMGGGMMGGGMAGNTESIFFVKPENDKGQYKVLPIMMSVFIDQDHIQDFLVELENSPMSIQVMDFEMQRPETRVIKPEKGAETSFAGYGGSMMGGYGGMMQMMMGGRRGGMGMSGYGGSMMGGYGGMMQMMMGGGKGGGMMGGYGGMGGTATARKGTDKRSVDRGKKREEEIKAAETSKGLSLFDPYFNIVEVKIYGQARFYNAPPEEPEGEASPGQVTAEAPKAEPAKPDAAAKPEPEKTEAKKSEPAKAETPKNEPTKDSPAKTEAAKGAEAKPAAPKP